MINQSGVLLLALVILAIIVLIFCTARIAHRVLDRLRGAKGPAMFTAYAVWISVLWAAYAAMGGSGGLLDGFGALLFLTLVLGLGCLLMLFGWKASDRAARHDD